MPRTLTPKLQRCLYRANPNVATFVEISEPDQAKVLRRGADEFLTAPPMVSVTPGGSAIANPSGGLTLASTGSLLVSQWAQAGGFNIPMEDFSHYFNSVAWRVDPAFPGAILRSVTVTIKYLHSTNRPNLKLQIFRAVQQAGVFQRQVGTSLVETAMTQVSFAPLLKEPVVRTFQDLDNAGAIDGAGFADVTFDLTPYRLAVYPDAGPPPGPGETGDLHELYFTVQTDQRSPGNLVEWRYDTTSAQHIAGVGFVRELSWTNAIPDDPSSVWKTYEPGRTLLIKIETELYVASSTLVHSLTLPALPDPASLGRIAFVRGTPLGTSATMELSTSGSGGPWLPVTNGDVVTFQQLVYHARLTLTSSADQLRAPVVSAMGVEFRLPVDVSPESTVEHMAQDVAVPFLVASIAEGKVTVARTGRRDYHDAATELAVHGPDTTLEADIFLGSRHPQVTRDDWFHAARALVSSRQPTPTTEVFSLLSIAKTLKRKIPEQVESINTTHVVVSATSTQVRVAPPLQGATIAGNEYDGKGYIMRVQSSVQVGIESGTLWRIDGNTSTDKLDFAALYGTLVAGDIIEVHSGQYAIPNRVWINQDPADIWWEILTVDLRVPPDRIGLSVVGSSGRGGLPPKVTDRAPGDPTTQAKLKVTFETTKQENGDAMIDQLSFIMGGATIEIAGQIVFRQIYPLTNAQGVITVPLDPVSAVFDVRDISALDTPTGRESRISLLSCAYGVDLTAALPAPVATIVNVDEDAMGAYGLQDVDGLSSATIPEDISRWLFNSADFGALLALMLAKQVVLACSTGVRVWPFSTVDAHPELTVGDSVVVVTDQYTDFDPGRRRKISGTRAYPLTLVGVSDGGRRFKGFLQGLAGISDVQRRDGSGTVIDPVAVVPLSMRIERTAASSTTITVKVYVADPAPTNNVPITITQHAEGVNAVAPASATLMAPADVITDDVATTAFKTFIITKSTAGDLMSRVSFTATRPGRLPVTQSLDAYSGDAIMPTFNEAKTVVGSLGTLAVTVADPQLRLVSLEFRTTTFTSVSAWTPVPGLPLLGFTASASVLVEAGANAFIEYRAQGYAADGVLRYLVTAVVPMNLDSDPAGPIHLAIDSSGNAQLSLNGGSKTLSWTYSWSTSSMPSDATVLGGTVVNGRVVQTVISAALALGATIYVKAVSWDQASGGGNFGMFVSATQTRQNKVTGKPITFAGTAGIPTSSTAPWLAISGVVSNAAASQSITWEIPLVMADGVTITGVESISQRTVAGDVANIAFFRQPRAGGAQVAIGSTQVNNTTGANQTMTQTSLSVTVDNTANYYFAFVQLQSAVGGKSSLSAVTVYYTSPDLSKSQ